MNTDELKVTLSMLDYDYISSSDAIIIFLKSPNIDPCLKKLLNDNKFIWIKVDLYDNNCAIQIHITAIKERNSNYECR